VEVGIGLPMRAMSARELTQWAVAAERGPFSSLNAGERLTFESSDPLIALAIASAVTDRIRLQTSVLCLPLHNAGVVAKQAASLELSSGGRLSLGVGIGSRPKDYAVAPSDWNGRARRFEEQLAFMRAVWAGESPVPDGDPVGPTPVRHGGPELIIGAFADAALRRAGRLADGVRSFDFEPSVEIHLARFRVVQDAWAAAGRAGRPRCIAATHYAVGENARAVYEAHAHRYYGYSSSAEHNALSASSTTSSAQILEFIAQCAEAGVDELVFTATTTDDVSAVDRLAQIVAQSPDVARSRAVELDHGGSKR
jgi:alkanesulfonate monooxygenase SsuD/methylene tetrahydromethanopterin reductase-like flavin-dependent oxidoreductase (luciferase family)